MSILLGAPTVMQLRATQFDGEEANEFLWRVRIGAATFGAHSMRPVSGHLRADGPEGWGEVDVSGFLLGTEDAPEAQLPALVGESLAAETLYDFARSHLQPLMSQVGSPLRIPYDSPPVTVTIIQGPDPAEGNSAGHEQTSNSPTTPPGDVDQG